MSYRGYSYSDSAPDEDGIKKDAEAILKFLKDPTVLESYKHLADHINQGLIFLIGRGLGGAVAAHMAKRGSEIVRGVVLESTFTSIPNLVSEHYFTWLKELHFLFLRNYWSTNNLVPELDTPILYLHGKKDQVVPYTHSE